MLRAKFLAAGANDPSELSQAKEKSKKRPVDKIGEAIGSPAYFPEFGLFVNGEPFRVTRYYFLAGVVVDQFDIQNDEIEREIQMKSDYFRERLITYLSVKKGQTLIMEENPEAKPEYVSLRDALKGGKAQ